MQVHCQNWNQIMKKLIHVYLHMQDGLKNASGNYCCRHGHLFHISFESWIVFQQTSCHDTWRWKSEHWHDKTSKQDEWRHRQQSFTSQKRWREFSNHLWPNSYLDWKRHSLQPTRIWTHLDFKDMFGLWSIFVPSWEWHPTLVEGLPSKQRVIFEIHSCTF